MSKTPALQSLREQDRYSSAGKSQVEVLLHAERPGVGEGVGEEVDRADSA